ncbi:hypothetical protein A7C99_0450 [Trichophyton rubrum]|uniref:Major facilitator superfamily (MFS) profile domain-containing protein n=4 Tax=Trichophyton TaxID=5550 RepID=A0A178F7K8_TRIRU|nr:Major facilitator superfamily domain [Trichophyton rubrum]OAL68054.1 hypothetical protein A7C99_0450 [Trichophyton rubrum]
MVFERQAEAGNLSSITLFNAKSEAASPISPSTARNSLDKAPHASALTLTNPGGDEDVELAAKNTSGKTSTEPPYHIFSHRQKWQLVLLVSIAGAFSPLSSNIYFPAIDTISSQLHVSASLVALTITVYLIVQGISPSIWGPMSDTSGRRITFVITLTIYAAANLALAFTANFPMLVVLRGVQALGSAATISISVGVIGDMACPEERGGFVGTNAGIRMIGQAVGPVIGGLLNSKWGFRSIFWLLFVQSIIVLVLLLVFLPETQRQLAGNGSIPLRGFHKPWLYYLRPPKSWATTKSSEPPASKIPRISLKSTLVPLTYVFQKDIFVLLAWGSLIYTLWSMVTSSTTTVLLHSFPSLTQWQIGLCFLPNGAGCVLGSLFTGRLLDRTFKRIQSEYKIKHGLPDSVNIKNIPDFPIERTRLQFMPYFSLSFIICVALYGPSFELNDLRRYFAANLVASLGLQFMIAFTSTAIFNINSTMLVDCFPNGSASATATNNLVRCLVGAAGVSVIQPLIAAVRVRNAFLILTGVVVLFLPLVWVQWQYCGKWRQERVRRESEKSRTVEK